MGYSDVYAAWKADPEAFWMAQADHIDWDRKPSRALDDSRAPFYEWFADGLVNTCWNAVDRHVVAGRGEQIAIIHDSPVTNSVSRITYADLRDRVASLAGALAARGVTKGDRVVIYMPMVPEALVAMLACTRIGAIHSVVFGGFAASELAVRIDDATPKAVIAGSCGIEGGASCPTSPCSTAPSIRPRTSRNSASCSSGTRRVPTLRGPRRGLARRAAWRDAGRLRSRGGQSPGLHPLYLRHDRRAQGRGAAHRGAPRRAELDDEGDLRRANRARCSGPPPMSAGSSGILTSAMRP